MRTLIGKGTFTKAYQINETQVEVVSTCPAKECYALLSQHNPFAPKIERVYGKENTFIMPLYPKVKAPKKQLNERAYAIYKALRKAPSYSSGYQWFCRCIRRISDAIMTDAEKEYICSLAGDVCNAIDCENMRFEISPRNISHDDQGNLILLDCFFCAKALHRARSRS